MERLQLFEERCPLAGVVEPLLPARIALFLGRFWQSPQCHAARGLEHLCASMGRDGEDRAGLREVVRAGEAATKCSGGELSELALGVSPLREVHLAEARDDKAQLPQSLEVDRRCSHRSAPFSSSGESTPPARTQTSTAESLHFRRRPILWAGSPRWSLHR